MDAAFLMWLERLLERGESVQTEPPPLTVPPTASARLEQVFRLHAFDVAGPAIPFHAMAAAQAALALAWHCWAVASADDSATGFDAGPAPVRASEHLSADLILRLFPMVHRRAVARAPQSELVAEQVALLRAWPLSGVLADLDGESSTPLIFDNHPGLLMLYAERLALKPRAGWLPPDGLALEWVERIFHERGKPLPARIAKETRGE